MGTATRAVVLVAGSRELELRDLELPDLDPFMVEVRVRAAGVCGSQLHQIDAPAPQDRLLGHEAVGVVTAVGRNVTHCKANDNVLLTWMPRAAQLADRVPLAAAVDQAQRGPVVPASSNVFAWASSIQVDEQYVVPVGDVAGRRPAHAAAIIGCAVMTGAGAVINVGRVRHTDSVAIWGCGGVGLSAVYAAKAAKAHTIVAIDQDPAKLDLAQRLGATHVVDTRRQDPVATIHGILAEMGYERKPFCRSGERLLGVNVTIDCIAAQWSIDASLRTTVPSSAAGRGGAVVLVGYPPAELRIDGRYLLASEIQLTASLGGSGAPDVDLPRYLESSRSGELDLDDLVTDTFSLEEVDQAVAALRQGRIRGRALLVFDD